MAFGLQRRCTAHNAEKWARRAVELQRLPVLRITNAECSVHIGEQGAPTGIGERERAYRAGNRPMRFFALNGKRLRQLPFDLASSSA